MINDRRQLADVYQQTIDIVLKGHYTSENGEEVKLLDNPKMLKGSRFYTKPLDASNVPSLAEGSTKIIVKNDDSIHCGHQLQQEGYKPVVLNLASRRTLAVVSVYRQNYNHQIINEMNEAYSENLSLITEYNIRNKK